MAGSVVRSAELPPRIGRHVVLGYLADGGMAEIFLGKDPDGRAIVIKRILPHLARQGNFVSMFVDEARIGSLVRHPNVVEIYELGQVGADLFLVMEYLAGETTSGLLRRLVARGERLPLALGAYLVAEACAGLHAAHQLSDEYGQSLGLVHRDVSPQNVFVNYDGTVKVLDFGIATAAHRLTRTATGQVKGKFSYMSPEQCRGEPLDLRSDIFSLGVLLYELTTQRRLFKRTNELMVLKAVTEQPIPRPSREVPGYPPALEAACMKALARDREQRHASADELRDELLAATSALDGPNDPRAALAAVMSEIFGERIIEKRNMLSHVRMGTDLGALPAAEVDESVEMPQVEEHSATPMPSRAGAAPSVLPPARRRVWPVILVLGVVVAGGAALWWLQQHDDEPNVAATIPITPAPAVAARPPAKTPSAPTRITLRVQSVPSGAALSIDAEAHGKTPATVQLSPGEHEITLVVAGHVRLAQRLTVDRDQDLLIPLVALRAQTPTPKPKPRPHVKRPVEPPPPRDPFKRYD